MPPRSNEFQRLVYLVKKVLAPTNATVTESRMLTDRETGDEREVDVCIEAELSGHPVTLCIECRDHKRLADVTWVEQMHSKHQRLPTGTLVLVSRSGFSKRAISLARVKGIDLLTYSALTDDSVGKAVDLSEPLWAMTFDLNVLKAVGTVPPEDDLPEERISLNHDNLLYDEQDNQVGTIGDLVSNSMRDSRVLAEFQRTGDESHNSFLVEVVQPRFSNESRLFLQKIEPRRMRVLDQFLVSGRARVARSRIPMQHGTLGPMRLAWGATKLGARDAMLLALAPPGAEPTLTLLLSEPELTATKTGEEFSTRTGQRLPSAE